jgi:fibronectin type 3 domain-containing protein
MRTSFPLFRSLAPRLLPAVLLLLAITGCAGDALAPDRAAALRAVSGGDQTALPGEALAQPLRVRVEDQSGSPVRGASVEWTVTLGGGSVDAVRTETDAEGAATVRWTLGEASGEQRVEARVAGAPAAVFGALATEVAQFRLSPRMARLDAPGDELVLRLVTRGAAGGDVASGVVTWHSSDTTVVTVFGGRIRAVGRGAATVLATGDGVADTKLVAVDVPAGMPVVVTGAADQRVSASEVRLAGTAAGNGYEGFGWLEWGRQSDLSDAAEVARGALAETGTRSMSATIGGLALNDSIYYRAVGQTSQGTTYGAIVGYLVAAPEEPTGLAAQITAPNFLLKLTWTVPVRGYSYAAERREEGQTEWTSTSQYYSNTGGYWAEYPQLNTTRTVHYRVRSCNAVGCTWSTPVSIVIPRLDPPQNVAAAVTDSGHVRLTWTDAPHETGYRVVRRRQGSPDPAQSAGEPAKNATSFTDRSPLLPGATYLYHVVSTLVYGGRTSVPSNEVPATPGSGETYPPIVVTGTGLQYASATSVTLRGTANGNRYPGEAWMEWSPNADLSGATETPHAALADSGTFTIAATLNGLALGTTVYFRVAAQNQFGTVRGAIASYTVALPAPVVNFRLGYGAPNYRTSLLWTPGERTARYAVEQRSHADSAWTSSILYTTPGGQWTEYPSLSQTRTVEYRVKSCNGVGCIHSAPLSLALVRLEAPSGLAGSADAANDVTLSWTPVDTRQTHFELYRRVSGAAAPGTLITTTPGTATGFKDTTAVAGVTYVYAARALLEPGARRSAFGNEVTVTAAPGTTHPPTANTGTAYQPVPAAGGGPNRVTLRGSAFGNGFAGESWFEWSTAANLAGAAEAGRDDMPASGGRQMSAVVEGLAPGTTIYFRVAAQNLYGTVRGSISSYTLGMPGAATGLSVQYAAPNFLVKLEWTPGERTAGYAVQQRVQGETEWTSTTLYTSNPGGSWTNYPSLTSTRTIEYRVQSCNGAGCVYSGLASQPVQEMLPPQGLSATVNGTDDVVLTWTDATSMETSYRVSRKVQGSSVAPTVIGNPARNTTTFVDTTATLGVTYEYTVRAVISYGGRTSNPSNTVVIQP